MIINWVFHKQIASVSDTRVKDAADDWGMYWWLVIKSLENRKYVLNQGACNYYRGQAWIIFTLYSFKNIYKPRYLTVIAILMHGAVTPQFDALYHSQGFLHYIALPPMKVQIKSVPKCRSFCVFWNWQNGPGMKGWCAGCGLRVATWRKVLSQPLLNHVCTHILRHTLTGLCEQNQGLPVSQTVALHILGSESPELRAGITCLWHKPC